MKEEFNTIIEQLRNSEINNYLVKKENLLEFRAQLLEQDDMIEFRGTGKHHGDTVFTFEPGWTK